MLFWILFLSLYILPLILSIIWSFSDSYKHYRKNKGKRESIVEALKTCTICLIPLINIIILIALCVMSVNEKIEKWIEDDPTVESDVNPEIYMGGSSIVENKIPKGEVK